MCECNGVLTRGGNRYFITFINDCSRGTYVYLMNQLWKIKKKREIKFFVVIEVASMFLLNLMHTAKNMALSINKVPLIANGLLERKNRTSVDMINAMNAKLSSNFWGEALHTACHVHK